MRCFGFITADCIDQHESRRRDGIMSLRRGGKFSGQSQGWHYRQGTGNRCVERCAQITRQSRSPPALRLRLLPLALHPARREWCSGRNWAGFKVACAACRLPACQAASSRVLQPLCLPCARTDGSAAAPVTVCALRYRGTYRWRITPTKSCLFFHSYIFF